MPQDVTLYVILALLVGAMWFMSRRSRKQQQKQQEFRDNLKPGDEVMTGSGLFGTVVEVEGDQVILESSPGTRTRWLKAAIARLVTPPVEIGDVDEDDDVDDEYDDEPEDDEFDDDIEVPDDLSSLDDEPNDDDDHPESTDTK
jgi:preprotein translocase subunit YajC